MKKVYEFNAVIKKVEKVNGAYIEFPFNVIEEFGSNKRVNVKATFDGEEYRGILVKMDTNCHIIGIRNEIRTKIGKTFGDEISVTIEEDNESKLMKIPDILQEELNNNETANSFFETLTESGKNKFIVFITSAKKDETKIERLKKVIQMLENNEKMK